MPRARPRPRTYDEEVLVRGANPDEVTDDDAERRKEPKRRRVVAVPVSVTPQRPTIVLQRRPDLSASDERGSPRKRLDLGLTFTYTLPQRAASERPPQEHVQRARECETR